MESSWKGFANGLCVLPWRGHYLCCRGRLNDRARAVWCYFGRVLKRSLHGNSFEASGVRSVRWESQMPSLEPQRQPTPPGRTFTRGGSIDDFNFLIFPNTFFCKFVLYLTSFYCMFVCFCCFKAKETWKSLSVQQVLVILSVRDTTVCLSIWCTRWN